MCYIQVREQRTDDDPELDKGVQLRQAGRRKAGDGVRAIRERALRVQDPGLADVRVHDQLHLQAQEPPRDIHEGQRPGELHHPAGETYGH